MFGCSHVCHHTLRAVFWSFRAERLIWNENEAQLMQVKHLLREHNKKAQSEEGTPPLPLYYIKRQFFQGLLGKTATPWQGVFLQRRVSSEISLINPRGSPPNATHRPRPCTRCWSTPGRENATPPCTWWWARRPRRRALRTPPLPCWRRDAPLRYPATMARLQQIKEAFRRFWWIKTIIK